MHGILDALRWVSAVAGVVLVLTGALVVIGGRGSGPVGRAFRGPRNASRAVPLPAALSRRHRTG